MEQQITDLLMKLVQAHPAIAGVVAVIGTLRVCLKPIMIALEQISAATESKKDDLLVQEVESSKIYKAISFVLDYVGSIKLPK